jgi:heterogeneous nuclear rnp K-like protein
MSSDSALSPSAPEESHRPSALSPPTALTLRSLITSREAGIVIGKAGKNVADIREQTGVKAGVTQLVQGSNERILTITGDEDSVAKVSLRLDLIDLVVVKYESSFRLSFFSEIVVIYVNI